MQYQDLIDCSLNWIWNLVEKETIDNLRKSVYSMHKSSTYEERCSIMLKYFKILTYVPWEYDWPYWVKEMKQFHRDIKYKKSYENLRKIIISCLYEIKADMIKKWYS
jgi:hypothetical protein